MNQELFMRFQQAQHHGKELQEKTEIVDRQITELQTFEQSLADLDTTKTKEMLAPLGKGVYVPTTITEDRFFVDVGAGIYVRKNSGETKAIITQQLSKLQEMKIQLGSEQELLEADMQKLLNDMESAQAATPANN